MVAPLAVGKMRWVEGTTPARSVCNCTGGAPGKRWLGCAKARKARPPTNHRGKFLGRLEVRVASLQRREDAPPVDDRPMYMAALDLVK